MGRTFESASRELQDLVSAMDQDKIKRMTSNKGVTWKRNPPAAPHFGGVFESIIKSAKCAIFAVLGDAEVNDEQLETIFIGVESLLNSRYLTAVNDDRVLTLNHFLEGVDTMPFNPRKRWRRVQELTRHVWHWWMKEYLPQIGSRPKWYFPTDNLRVGDVVVVIDPGTVSRQWNVGRIVQTYLGPDGPCASGGRKG